MITTLISAILLAYAIAIFRITIDILDHTPAKPGKPFFPWAWWQQMTDFNDRRHAWWYGESPKTGALFASIKDVAA